MLKLKAITTLRKSSLVSGGKGQVKKPLANSNGSGVNAILVPAVARGVTAATVISSSANNGRPKSDKKKG